MLGKEMLRNKMGNRKGVSGGVKEIETGDGRGRSGRRGRRRGGG